MIYIILTIVCNIAVWFSGYMLGVTRTKQQLAMNIIEDPDRIMAIVQQIKDANDESEQMSDPTEVLIEQHNNQFFVYNKETHLFLGQGPSKDEAMDVVVKRFPTELFVYEDN